MAIANDAVSKVPTKVTDEEQRERLDPALLRRLYTYMLKCRMMEERIRTLYRQGRFAGNYFSAVGQEATEVGATLDLLPEDAVAPSHRNFVTNLMKGTPLPLMFAHLYGRKTSPDQGRSAPAHCGYAPLNIITPSSTIAAQLNIGTGIALQDAAQAERGCSTLGGGFDQFGILARSGEFCWRAKAPYDLRCRE